MVFGLVGLEIQKEDKVLRENITPKQWLIAKITFLPTGISYQRLKCSTGISASCLYEIIPETCAIVFRVLKINKVSYT